MTRIELTEEQAAIVAGATEPVRICLPDGSIAGWLSSTMHLPTKQPPFSPEEVEAAERAYDKNAGGRSTKEVLDSLRKKTQDASSELSPSELAEIRRRLASNEPRYTTDEALARVRSTTSP
jgi:hypothetical protein